MHRTLFGLSLCLLASTLILTAQVPRACLAETDGQPSPLVDAEKTFAFEGAKLGLSGRIAFTAEIDGVENIFVFDLDARKFRTLVISPGGNSLPTWSPAGDGLAFSSNRDGKKRIYVANWDGANQQRLTSSQSGSEDSPHWSPDGTKVLFSRSESDGPEVKESNIFAADVKSQSVSALTTFKQRNTFASWSPNGAQLTYSTTRFWPGWNVCTLHLRDKKEQCLPTSDGKSHFRSEWSHSGKQLAYSIRSGGELIDLALWEIETRTFKPLVEDNGKNYDAEFSSDDHYITYAHQEADAGPYNLFIIDPSDKEGIPQKIITSKYSLRYPTWTASKTYELEARQLAAAQGSPLHAARKATAISLPNTPLAVTPAP